MIARKPHSEQQQLLGMLERADIARMLVIDTYTPNEATVTIENLQVCSTRIDVVFQFEHGWLKRVWAREG